MLNTQQPFTNYYGYKIQRQRNGFNVYHNSNSISISTHKTLLSAINIIDSQINKEAKNND